MQLLKKLKIYLFAMLLAGSILLSGCSISSESDSDSAEESSAVVEYTCISKSENSKKIYVILKNYHGDYWKKVINGISSSAEKTDASIYLGGIDNETDISGQIALVDEAIAQGADGILLAPANSNSLTESCQKIMENRIPLVLIDSSINSDAYDACYMTDNIDAGERAAREMIQMLRDAGNSPTDSLEVGILLSSDSSQAMVNRVSGFLDYWSNYAPDRWNITKDIFLNGGNVEKATSDATTLLNDNKQLKGIFGCNNTSTIGISKALMKEKRTDVVMVGFDLSDEARQLIQSSDYHGVTLMQKQDQMGSQGILALNSFIKGEGSDQKFFDTGITLITKKYLTENDVS